MSSRRGSGSERGRGRGRSNSGNPDFLWVNRTPDSERLNTSRQERDELRTITNHARQWRAALRRQQRLYAAQTEASLAQSVVGWARQTNTSISDSSSVEASAVASPMSPLPIERAHDDYIDSFTCLEIPDDTGWARHAFRFATGVWLPSVFQSVRIVDLRGDSLASMQPTMIRIINGALTQRMHMFCLLAASSAYRKYVLRLLPLALDSHGMPEYCMVEALQHLRRHLESNPNPQVDEMLLFDLEALALYESYLGNFEGARVHLEMVLHLVRSTDPGPGMPVQLPLPMRLLCWLSDLSVAGGLGQAPLIPVALEARSLLPIATMDPIRTDLVRRGIALGGSALVRSGGILHPILLDIVFDTVHWFHVHQHNHTHIANARPQNQPWTMWFSYGLIHRLLSWCADTPGQTYAPQSTQHNLSESVQHNLSDSIQHILSESMKQAILLLFTDFQSISNRHSSRDPIVVSPWSTPARLRTHLTQLYSAGSGSSSHTDQQEDMILWMACLGSQLANHEPGDQDWFVDLATRLARTRHITTTHDLTQLMTRYLYRCDSSGRADIEGLQVVLEDRSALMTG